MPVSLQSYAVLLSRPGDANHYAEIAANVIEAINRQHSRSTGVHFHLLDWAKDSYADSGAEPQQLLNRQIVDDADIVLAIFNERMGTPTQKFDSGTEEEIMLALEENKTVQAYFWQPPQGFIPADASQFERLESFKSRISGKLIYATFSDETELREKVMHDFTKRMFELEDDKPVRKPLLNLVTIGPDGKPMRQPTSQLIVLSGRYNAGGMARLVRSALEKAVSIELPKPESKPVPGNQTLASTVTKIQVKLPALPSSETLLSAVESVEVDGADRNVVRRVLEELCIDVPQDLFNIGELRRSKLLAYSPISGDGIQGTDKEKAKHHALIELIDACRSYEEYKQFLSSMNLLVGLPLLIENNGHAPATHVTVDVFVPKSLYIPVKDIPIPAEGFIERNLDDADVISRFARHVFDIPESYEYHSYYDSRVQAESGGSIPPMHTRTASGYPFYGLSSLDSDDYKDEIKYCFKDFSFKTSPGEDVVAVSVSFDRVQQNNLYAFPALIPLRRGLVSSLEYRINADELEEPIEGIIPFEAEE